MPSADAFRDLGEQGWQWVLGQVGEGPCLADADEGERDSLYAGIGGLSPVLAELRLSRSLTDREQQLADGVVARLLTSSQSREEFCLYDGLAGDLTALRLLEPGSERPVVRRLGALQTPRGWRTTVEMDGAEFFSDVVLGTAGILMALLWADAPRDVLDTAAESLLAVAEPTLGGLDWRWHPTYRSSNPNFSHGTAGVASALALAGVRLERPELVENAVLGARHLLAVGTLDERGFAVPHTFPPSTRDVEPVTYSWCHGPAGLTYLFAALAHAGVRMVGGNDVRHLRDLCLTAVVAAGVPRRLRPGFWDNDGRCCGTAGVGEAVLDTFQAGGDEALLDFAVVLGDALVERAVVDGDGARWQFVEHRQDPPLLPPRSGWMQGAAGISAYLLRLARVLEQGRAAPVVDRPDQWWAVPAAVRVSGT